MPLRFNEKELKQLASKRPTVQGALQYMKPQGSDWSDWYQQSVYKERVFKLVQNFLFYYRTTDLDEPLGAFILEQMEVAYEHGPAAFTFSLSLNDGKHIFACRCQEDLNKWVAALKVASYTYWRSQHEVLQCKLAKLKGLPWTPPYSHQQHQQSVTTQNASSTFYMASPPANVVTKTSTNDNNVAVAVITRKMSKSTFYSQSEMSTTQVSSKSKITTGNMFMNTSNVPVENLIDL